MRYQLFAPGTNQYPVMILSKNINQMELLPYVDGCPQDFIAYQLPTSKQISKKDLEIYLETIYQYIPALKVDYLVITDAQVFKLLAKVRKADQCIGYVYPLNKPGLEHVHLLYAPSPSVVLRDPEQEYKVKAFRKALDAHRQGTYMPPGIDIIHSAEYPKTVDEIIAALTKLLHKNLSCDIETFSLKHVTAGIGTITFCDSQHTGIAFAVDKDTPHHISKQIRRVLRDFFEARRQLQVETIYHRSWFDVNVLIYQLFMKDILDREGLLHGLDIMMHGLVDTQLIRYLATNTCAGNNLTLKEAAQVFCGSYMIDVKDITKVRLQDLLLYNLTDGLATWYTYNTNYPKMVRDQQLDIYQRFISWLTDIIHMQLTGMPMNMQKVIAGKAKMEDARNQALSVILASPEVALVNNAIAQAWADKRNAELKKKRVTPADCKDTFNVNSGPQLQILLHEVMGLPVLERTDSGLPATGMDSIEGLANHAQNNGQRALLKALIDYKEVEKILTAFIPAFEAAVLGPDGWHYLFGSFNLGGTLSGRLSCVAGWTRIQTQRGLVPIQELVPGDQAWTHSRRWRPITRLIKKPVEQMVDVCFSNGYVLTCTTAHKLRLPTGEWASIQEIIDGRIQNVDAEPCQYRNDSGSCEDQPDLDLECSGRTAGNQGSERKGSVTDAHAGCRVLSSEGTAVFHFQGGREEPYEGEIWNSTSSMGRGSFGSQGIPDDAAQRGASARASCGDGAGIKPTEAARRDGCPSHRQQPIEQLIGQLGLGDQSRAQDYPLNASDVCCGEIQTIHHRGPAQVWDISVEEDESYWAEGCFNHNSSDPNLQNLPSTGTDWAKIIKEMFEAPPGKLFIGLDFDSLEDKISALTTKDPNKLAVYTDLFDGHSLRAYSYFRDQMLDIERAPEGVRCFKANVGGTDVCFHAEEQVEYLGQTMRGIELYELLVCQGV